MEMVAAGANINEIDKIMHLLSTFPPSYDGIVTAIETLCENDLTLDQVKIRLLNHEIKINTDSKDTSAKALQTIVLSKDRKKIKNKSKKNFNKNKQFKNKGKLTCFYCGKIGHIKRDCYKFKNEFNKSEENNKNANLEEKENISFVFMVESDSINENKTNKFVIDSGASDHIVNDESLLKNVKHLTTPIKVNVAKTGSFIEANKIGVIEAVSNGNKIILKDVLFCKDITNNLLTVSKMQKASMTITFDDNGVSVSKGSVVVLQGNMINNMPIICFSEIKIQPVLLSNVKSNKFDL